jgi:hypothetical protein
MVAIFFPFQIAFLFLFFSLESVTEKNGIKSTQLLPGMLQDI